MWILSNLRVCNCEFRQKWDFQNENFVKNEAFWVFTFWSSSHCRFTNFFLCSIFHMLFLLFFRERLRELTQKILRKRRVENFSQSEASQTNLTLSGQKVTNLKKFLNDLKIANLSLEKTARCLTKPKPRLRRLRRQHSRLQWKFPRRKIPRQICQWWPRLTISCEMGAFSRTE